MQMKAELLKYGDRDTGRVPLATFYTAALEHGSHQFTESKEYLVELGALDESDPRHPYVIVPNYILSKTNCISTSNLHSTCCINECESLLGHLETLIASPEAEPGHVATLVADLPSSSVQGSRKLSEPLIYRLNEIGEVHGGKVPLHGRLFAQWMHHAYPRECLFPPVSGSTSPPSLNEWLGDMEATREEMERISSQEVLDHEAVSLPWIEIEELVAPAQQD